MEDLIEGLEPLDLEATGLGLPADLVDVEGLGSCNVIKIHDDGDLTVKCGGKKYMITPEGDIFEEKAKTILDEVSGD